ncbi:MAG: outer membrane beta-barrel protein [Acidobacteriota bacterium]
MKRLLRFSVPALMMMAAVAGWAQKTAPAAQTPANPYPIDVGISYTYKVAKIAGRSSSNFGLQGGAIDVTWWTPQWPKLGLAAELSSETNGNISPGVSLTQVSVVAGPRYRLWSHSAGHVRMDLFGEALAGLVRANNGVFPSNVGGSPDTKASSFAFQTGGGVNFNLNQRVALRLPQVDYVYSQLPNNTNGAQSDLRIAAGVVFHL